MTGETGKGDARDGGEDGNAHGRAPAGGTGQETDAGAGDRSLVVIVPAALRPEAIALGGVLGYTISFDFPLSADGGATVTHFALHAGAGPVMRLILAGEGSADPAAAGASSAVLEAFAALAASGTGAAAVAAFRAALLTSVRGGGEPYGLDHLREVCAAEGLVFAAA